MEGPRNRRPGWMRKHQLLHRSGGKALGLQKACSLGTQDILELDREAVSEKL